MSSAEKSRVPGLIFFMLRFLVLALGLVALWWWMMPWYGMVLGQAGGGIARFGLGTPITGVAVLPEGFLNTETKLRFYVAVSEEHTAEPTLFMAQLVTNVVPYVALVLATAGLALAHRLRVLLLGTSILVAGHILFVALFLAFQEVLRGYAEVVTASLQFFLILPFLLWVWLVYSDRIASFLAEEDDDESPTAP